MAECVECLEKAKVLDYLSERLEDGRANDDYSGFYMGYIECLEDAIQYFTDMPAADVAPVVRCENCKSGIMSDDNKYIICCRLGVGMELDGFCSHGERKIT